MNIIKNRASAFTLAEMMIVLLVLSLITAAFLPVITTKSRSSGSDNPWIWSGDRINAIFNAGNVSGAVIGINNFAGGDPTSKLLINTATLGPNHILFKENGATVGRLTLDSHSNVGLGNVTFDTVPPAAPTKYNATAIGSGAVASDTRATALGSLAIASGSYSLAAGAGFNNPARAVGHYSVAVGSDAAAFSNNSVAMGLFASAGTDGDQFGTTSATAVGNNAVASAANSMAYGVSAVASAEASIAIGSGSEASGPGSVSIGNGSIAAQDTSIGLGGQAWQAFGVSIGNGYSDGEYAIAVDGIASGYYSISIGGGSQAQNNYSIALGASTNATGVDGIAIGRGATASASGGVAIGQGAVANTANQIVLGGPGTNTKVTGLLMVGSFVSGGSVLYQNMGMLSTSDRRLKNVGGEFTEGLDKIRELKTYNYTFKEDKEKIPRVGVMAQDLQKIFPNAIFKLDKEGHLGLRQEDMFYAMINAIKQLDKTVQELVARVGSIDEKITMLIKANQINSQKLDKISKELNEVKFQNKQLKSQVLALKAKVK